MRIRLLVLLSLLVAPIWGQVFPGSVATDADLLVARDKASSTLDGDIDGSVNTFNVTVASTFTDNMVVVIDDEQIFCTTFSGTTFSGCTRGYGGTSAAPHDSGAGVYGYIVAAHHNGLKDELKAIENSLLGSSYIGTMLRFGGTSSSYPALKRSGTGFEVRLADDSADGHLKASVLNAATGFQVNGGATTGHFLRGDGTNFVSSAIQASDLQDLNYTWTGTHDFSAAILEAPNSTSLPGTCAVGEVYVDSDASAGQRLYLCESADTWVLQTQPVYNVKAFGAVGDGSTDDTSAIQAAIDAAEAAGRGVVYFPAGQYKISATLTLASNGLHLIGAGITATEIILDSTMTTQSVFYQSATHQECSIRGMKITGFANKTDGWAIYVVGAWRWKIEDVYIYQVSNGIYLGDFGGAEISSVNIREVEPSTGIGISLVGGNDAIIDSLIMDNSSDGLAGISVADGFAIHITNVDVINSGIGLLLQPVASAIVGAVYVSNSEFDNCDSAGVRLNSTAEADAYIQHVSFSNVWIAASGAVGFQTMGSNGHIYDVHLANVRVRTSAQTGINLGYGTDISIVNCTVCGNNSSDGANFHGIAMDTVTGVRVIGTRSGYCSQVPTDYQRYGIYVTSNASRVLLADNDLEGNLNGRYFVSSAATDVVVYDETAVGGTNGFKILDWGSKPTCDVTTRGFIWREEGGVGAADTLEVCAKNSSNTYAWYSLASIP